MHARCDPNTKNGVWKRRYADRGIGVCDEWRDPWKFIDWAQSNGFSPELTLDRIDNDASYSPDNCRWVGTKIQARNKENNVGVLVIDDGRTFRTTSEAAEALNTSQDRIYKSLKHGWKCFGLTLARR
jgi:hypothetical protein